MLIVRHLGTPNSSFPVASICFTGCVIQVYSYQCAHRIARERFVFSTCLALHNSVFMADLAAVQGQRSPERSPRTCLRDSRSAAQNKRSKERKASSSKGRESKRGKFSSVSFSESDSSEASSSSDSEGESFCGAVLT